MVNHIGISDIVSLVCVGKLEAFTFKIYSVFSQNALMKALLSFRKGIRWPRVGYTGLCLKPNMLWKDLLQGWNGNLFCGVPQVVHISAVRRACQQPGKHIFPRKRPIQLAQWNQATRQLSLGSSLWSRIGLDTVLDFKQWPEGRSTHVS